MYEERLGKLNMNAWLSTNLIRDQEINLQLFNSQNVNVIGEADLKKKCTEKFIFQWIGIRILESSRKTVVSSQRPTQTLKSVFNQISTKAVDQVGL